MKEWIGYVLISLCLVTIFGCTTTTTTTTAASNTADGTVTTGGEAADINLKLGVGYMQAGRFDIARSKLQRALEYNPNYAEAHNALGVLYETTGAGLQAEQHYEKALQSKPDYTLARINYGRLLCASNKSAEGEQQFLMVVKQSISDSPRSGTSWCRGMCSC